MDEDGTDVAAATVTWFGAIGTVVVTAGTTVPAVVDVDEWLRPDPGNRCMNDEQSTSEN